MPKIFCFVNSTSPGWYHIVAMAEDGHVLAGHASSTLGWAQHDIGYTSDWKHDSYRAHYPDGYELVWVEQEEVPTHTGLNAAYALNQQLATADTDE